jgi:hypothetical protein
MAMIQLKCPETGKPLDIGDVPPDALMALSLSSRPIACPHCGKDHPWSSGHLGVAMQAIHRSPEASRVLVVNAADGVTASTLS